LVTEDEALLELLAELKDRDYRFVAVTPDTHARFLARPPSDTSTLRDIFGWNRYFAEHEIEPQLLALLRCSKFVEETGDRLRSLVRVASLEGELFLHSSFPTTAPDAVFFGPDTYRFTRFVCSELRKMRRPSWIVDMGAGSGAGGIVAAKQVQSARLSLIEVNPVAARFAGLNARVANVPAEVTVGDQIPEGCDLVIANPPYMIDSAHRSYRDGGGMFGGQIACDWAKQALRSLAPGGKLLLYTGAAVIAGRPPLLDNILALSIDTDAEVQLEEIDPDVFGEELGQPGYKGVERIAALGIKITKP
jgi:methylase of polypeptide subunit release factors